MKKKITKILNIFVLCLILLTSFSSINVKAEDDEEPVEEDPMISVIFFQDLDVLNEVILKMIDEKYYAFLPSYANLNELELKCDNPDVHFLVNGKESNSIFTANDSLSITIYGQSYPLVIMSSSNLSTISIKTKNYSLDPVNESRYNTEKVHVLCIKEDGTIESAEEGQIKMRGHTSALVDKKTYRLKMKEEISLAGLEPSKKWILNANYLDASKIRNSLGLYLAKQLGQNYTSDYEYVDLYVDNNYYGNYLVQEAVEISESRVDIPIENSFLMEISENDTGYKFIDIFGLPVIIKEPENLGQEIDDKMQEYIETIENMILNIQEDDSLDELSNYIDLKSFATVFIIDEIVNQRDANYRSTFFYYDGRSGLLYAGPTWDLDLSLGNDAILGSYYQINSFKDGLSEFLWRNKEFKELVKIIFNENKNLLSEVLDYADKTVLKIKDSVKMDEILWDFDNPNIVNADEYQTDVEYTKWYLEKRFNFIKDVINNPESYHVIHVLNENTGRAMFIKDGECIPSSLIDYVSASYGADGLMFNDVEIWDGYPIFEDMLLMPVWPETIEEIVDENVTNEESGGFKMDLLMLIVLFVPGVIALFISDFILMKQKEKNKLFIHYCLHEFFIILFTYGVLYLFKKQAFIIWSGQLVEGYNSFADVRFGMKMMLLMLAGSVISGILLSLLYKYVIKDKKEI